MDSPFLVGGATSLEGALDALGSQTQRVIAMESALVAAWTRGSDLAGRNRELLAQRAEDSAVINRARREREDALGEAAHLRRDIAAYDAVFRTLGMLLGFGPVLGFMLGNLVVSPFTRSLPLALCERGA